MNTIAEHLTNTQIDMVKNIKNSNIIDNLSMIISLCEESNNVDKEVGKCLQKYFSQKMEIISTNHDKYTVPRLVVIG